MDTDESHESDDAAVARGQSLVLASTEVDSARLVQDKLQDKQPGTATDISAAPPAAGTVYLPAAAPQAPPAKPEPAFPTPGTVIRFYELIRVLGRGGMGAVFLGRDVRLGRLVAIKIVSQISGVPAKRFIAEARATAQCKHENIVVIHDVDEHDGYSYMVLEYIEGRTLREWLRERYAQAESETAAPVSASVAIDLITPVIRALAHAHRLGFVHRDLKPENVMLSNAGTVKVLDFGIAKLVMADEDGAVSDPSLPGAGALGMTNPGALVGTVPYMSPEQWRGEKVDHRSDLWAVGIMLYELVTGKHPLAPVSLRRLMVVANPGQPMPLLAEARPELGRLAAIVDRCLRKAREERFPSAEALLAALESLVPRLPSAAGGEAQDPFVGLASFQASHAERFFGRTRDVGRVLARLRSRPLIAIAGPSGAGKSSLVRAGIIPALLRADEGWEPALLRPGRAPLISLATALAEIMPDTGAVPGADPHILAQTLAAQPGYLGAELRRYCRDKERRVLLFIDQFEELYTLCSDADERSAFAACLEAVADDASSPLRVILALRSDFLDRVAEDRASMREVTRGLELLPPMDRDGLREALSRPVEAAGYQYQSQAIVDTMLSALAGARSPLPLLQFTAAKLWESRDRERRLITQASYDALGGIEGALSSQADAVLAGLSTRQQALARAVFLRLVTPERTRAIVSVGELRELGDSAGELDHVVQHLADARLLLIEGSSRAGSLSGQRGDAPGGATVELVHESLIEKWTKLARWLEEHEDDAQFLGQVRMAASQWQASGRAEDVVWRGQAAHKARLWLDSYRAAKARGELRSELGTREEQYLAAVVALAGRATRKRRLIVAGVIAAFALAALAFASLAVTSRRGWDEADREAKRAATAAARAEAEAARARAEARDARNATRMAAARELTHDPTTVLALLRELEETPPRGWSGLVQWAFDVGISAAVLPHAAVVSDAGFSPDRTRIVTAAHDAVLRVWNGDGSAELGSLRGHEKPILAACFSPDSMRIASASVDRTVRVWSADGSGAPLILRGHEEVVLDVSFSPDGTRIVSGSADYTARIWSADGNGQPLVLRGHTAPVTSAVFSPDGTRVLTASWDQTVRLWNADGSGAAQIFRVHQAGVLSAAFSPDGTRIITASEDQTVRVWNLDGDREALVFRGHEHAVNQAWFSPDGTRIVSASTDQTVRVWNADGSGQPIVFRGHEAKITAVAFHPDGREILTSSEDHTARIFRLERTDGPVVLSGHAYSVSRALFSPDGERIATASRDHTVRIWNADGTGEPLVLRGHSESVLSVAFSPDGTRIVTASVDRTARVWDARGGAGEPVVLRGHNAPLRAAAFSPDGTRVVTTGFDQTVRVWHADGSGEPVVLRGHQDVVVLAAFSPDSQRILSASLDHTVRVWNADGSGQPVVLHGHEDSVHFAAWSPDGMRIVAASVDGTARVFRANGTGEPVVLRGHDRAVHVAAFSPDGTRIVTASDDSTVRVWNADGSGQPLVLQHPHAVKWVAFSPDGTRIVTVPQDGSAWVWNANGSGEPLSLRGHEAAVVWAEFSPDGQRVVTASDDTTARVWSDLVPPTLDAPQLWTATSYCMPIERRQRILGVAAETAAADYEACRRRVQAGKGKGRLLPARP